MIVLRSCSAIRQSTGPKPFRKASEAAKTLSASKPQSAHGLLAPKKKLKLFNLQPFKGQPTLLPRTSGEEKTHDKMKQNTDAFAPVLTLMDQENLIRPLNIIVQRRQKDPSILSSKLTKEEISKRIREIDANIEAMLSSLALIPPMRSSHLQASLTELQCQN
jgi:hypothetical protein